jgi:serine/threonine protein kinase
VQVFIERQLVPQTQICTVVYGINTGGTPGYMAPEVAAGGPISKAGDVFSFGATLFHIVAGRRPRQGQVIDVWTAIPRAPKELRDLILAACAASPAVRPNMSQLLWRLKCWTAPAGKPVSLSAARLDFLGKALKVTAAVGGIGLLAAIAIAIFSDE